jgi:hypothetical protein
VFSSIEIKLSGRNCLPHGRRDGIPSVTMASDGQMEQSRKAEWNNNKNNDPKVIWNPSSPMHLINASSMRFSVELHALDDELNHPFIRNRIFSRLLDKGEFCSLRTGHIIDLARKSLRYRRTCTYSSSVPSRGNNHNYHPTVSSSKKFKYLIN